jgi:hypothetical protein
MLMSADTQAASLGELLEAGRYKAFEAPDGSWVLARATGTCESCQSCGCGEQADPIHIPAMFVAMAKSGGGLGSKLKGLMARG